MYIYTCSSYLQCLVLEMSSVKDILCACCRKIRANADHSCYLQQNHLNASLFISLLCCVHVLSLMGLFLHHKFSSNDHASNRAQPYTDGVYNVHNCSLYLKGKVTVDQCALK